MWHSLTSSIPRRALWPSVALLLLLGVPVVLAVAVLGLLRGLLRLLLGLLAGLVQVLAVGLFLFFTAQAVRLLLGSMFNLPPWLAWAF